MSHKLKRGSIPLALTIFLLIVSIAGITLVFIQSKVDVIKSSVQPNENSVTDASYNSLLSEEFNQLLCRSTYSVTNQTIVNDGNYLPIEANLESQIFSKLQGCASNSSTLLSSLGSPSNSSSIISVLSKLKNQSIDYNWFDADNNAGAGYLLWPQGGLPSLPQRAVPGTVSGQAIGYGSPVSKVFNIPDLLAVTGVTVDNGTCSYTTSGQNVTVTCQGGNGTPYGYWSTYSMYVGESLGPSESSSFPGSLSYNDGIYSGTLGCTGISQSGSITLTGSESPYINLLSPSNNLPGSVPYSGSVMVDGHSVPCSGTLGCVARYHIGMGPDAGMFGADYTGTISGSLTIPTYTASYAGYVYRSVYLTGTEYIYNITVNYNTTASNPNATFPGGVGDIPLENETIILNTHADGTTSMSTIKVTKFNMHVVLTGNSVVCTLTGKLISSGS